MYGEKDMVDIEAFGKVAKGLPFWFAGSYGKKEKLCEVLEGGGNGIQVSSCQFQLFNASVSHSSDHLTIVLRSVHCSLLQMRVE